MTPLQYKTVLKYASVEFEEKKSKFIASIKPVSSEKKAIEFINTLKSKHWDATHNVFAYCIGGDNIIQRFSDDGEPSGTAGLPMLNVIKKMRLQNLVIVVTRYFGGTLLGAGGLVRAYAKSASLAIEESGIAVRKMCREVNIIFDYPVFDKMKNYAANSDYSIKDVKYTQNIEMTIMVPVSEIDNFIEYINEITNGDILIKLKQTEYT